MTNMNSPPTRSSASGGASENQAAPEYTILPADENPRMQPSPLLYTPLFTATANTSSGSTGYELRLATADGNRVWQGPIYICERAATIDMPEALCRQLANGLEAQFYYSIIDLDGQIVGSGSFKKIMPVM
ncbi:c20f5a80-017c-45c0-9da6-0d14f18529e1-CDS [Sclerotinia trifoliorum]|uniref:C20f5a80-017c-45c0-9da6-0d14f18529e1-CDS n=1 Tax=Sclerotinia trifoliorum TaxID=28548 RepID=A0A8H2VUJ9_9HELO|nr:c20f5a80-017c-45c0-9da6-0d14f18529e1-CDS [Sclerotinia trifoliorum]